MAGKATWLEVYQNREDDWKVSNGRTSRVLRSAGTKRQAMRKARNLMDQGHGDKYVYVSAQVYDSKGNKSKRIVNNRAVKTWTSRKATNR